MSAFKKTFRTLTAGGLLFIFPLLILIILVNKALQILKPLVLKLITVLDIHSVFGAATVSIVSIILIILLCFISGLLIHVGFLHKWNSSLEETLYLLFPPLQRLRFRFFDESEGSASFNWKSILLKQDEGFNVAFITASDKNGYLSIFIPDPPDISTGEVRFVEASNCIYHPISRKLAMKLLQRFGKDWSSLDLTEIKKM